MPSKESASALEQAASSSQADTEPLPFDDDEEEEEEEEENEKLEANEGDLKAENMAGSVDEDAAGTPVDTSMGDVGQAAGQNVPFSDALTGLEDAEGEEDVGAMGSEGDDEDAIAEPDEADDTGHNTAEGEDTGAAPSSVAGAGFSDDSELTDESDDEDAEGEDEEDNDEMGSASDEDEDGDGEDEDEDAEGEEEGDEDEAAKALAALTSTQGDAASISENASQQEGEEDGASGLNGLAVLAAAGAGDADQLQGDSDSESVASSRAPAVRPGRGGRFSAKPRLGSRLNEVMIASEPTSDQDEEETRDDAEGLAEDADEEGQEDEEDEEEEENEDGSSKRPKTHSREMSSLGHLASAAKRTAARSGPTAGLLAGAPAITIEEAASGAASLASTPAGSPKPDEEVEEIAEGIADGIADAGHDEEKEEKEAETPIQELEEVAAEEEPSTDEAAVKRQEAIDALTKIEIGFAVLRDKLYVERMDEVSREGEMILEGSHPDLIYLTNFIEARRERRLKLVELWFEQQQQQYGRVAHAEEAAAWNNWRNEVVTLRQEQLDSVSRKRRKLDREKRALDGPRPARRHQIFETELVRNPDYDAAQAKATAMPHSVASSNGKAHAKKKTDPRQQEMEDLEEMGAYVAYPDLRGAEDQEAWMDLERMGVQTDVRMLPGGALGYYRADEMGMDPYGQLYAEGQMPPPGAEMLPPSYGAGPPPNGMMLDRQGERGPPQPQQMAGFVDGYGAPGFGAPMHPGQRNGRAGGHPGEAMYMDERMNMNAQHSVHHQPPSGPSRKRMGSPSGGRAGKQHMEDVRAPRKSEGQSGRRSNASGAPRSPPPGPMRKGMSAAQQVQHANGPPPLPPGPPQRGPYGGAPPMHDDRYFDPPPPLHPNAAYGGGQPPPSSSAKMQGAPNGTFGGGGPMMGSPHQPHHLPLPPPPPPMGHPIHGGPPVHTSGYQPGPGRRGEPMYQR